MNCHGYICISKWREGLRLQKWHVIIHTVYFLGHSCSQFWPMLHWDNAQIWFKETGNPGKNCGWDNCDDGALNHMELSGPLGQKGSPGLQPLQSIHIVFRIQCATIKTSESFHTKCCRNMIGQSYYWQLITNCSILSDYTITILNCTNNCTNISVIANGTHSLSSVKTMVKGVQTQVTF